MKILTVASLAFSFLLYIPILYYFNFIIYPAVILAIYLVLLFCQLYRYKCCKNLEFLLVEDTLVGIVEAERRHPIFGLWENAFYFSRYGRAVARQDDLRVAASGDTYLLALLGNRKQIAAFFSTKTYRPEKTEV